MRSTRWDSAEIGVAAQRLCLPPPRTSESSRGRSPIRPAEAERRCCRGRALHLGILFPSAADAPLVAHGWWPTGIASPCAAAGGCDHARRPLPLSLSGSVDSASDHARPPLPGGRGWDLLGSARLRPPTARILHLLRSCAWQRGMRVAAPRQKVKGQSRRGSPRTGKGCVSPWTCPQQTPSTSPCSTSRVVGWRRDTMFSTRVRTTSCGRSAVSSQDGTGSRCDSVAGRKRPRAG